VKKILIIDDDPSNREILRARLEPAGYEVLEASHGEEGLLLSETVLPDLILLDVMMPKMDGWQVCRKIRANPITKAKNRSAPRMGERCERIPDEALGPRQAPGRTGKVPCRGRHKKGFKCFP
jgi:CheY-like chemotaxis protein